MIAGNASTGVMRMANQKSAQPDDVTWLENPEDVIVLANRSQQNFILELPTGRYRLDAGRRMRTMRSILKYDQVMELIHDGKLAVE
jgi:hypothetical protein